MEQLPEKEFSYYWLNNLVNENKFESLGGKRIEVIFPGVYSTINRGPDFKNARIRINGRILRCDIEIHRQSRDWLFHNHHKNPEFNNVICQFAEKENHGDFRLETENGNRIHTVIVEKINRNIGKNCELENKININTAFYLPCYQFYLRKTYKSRIKSVLKFYSRVWLKERTKHISGLKSKLDYLKLRSIFLIKKIFPYFNSVYYALLRRILFFSIAECLGFSANKENFIKLAGTINIESLKKGGKGYQPEGYQPRVEEILKENFSKINWNYILCRPYNFPERRLQQFIELIVNADYDILNLLFPVINNRAEVFYNILHNRIISVFGEQFFKSLYINAILPFLLLVGLIEGKGYIVRRALKVLFLIKRLPLNHKIRFISFQLFMKNKPPREFQSPLYYQALLLIYKKYCANLKCGKCPIVNAKANRRIV